MPVSGITAIPDTGKCGIKLCLSFVSILMGTIFGGFRDAFSLLLQRSQLIQYRGPAAGLGFVFQNAVHIILFHNAGIGLLEIQQYSLRLDFTLPNAVINQTIVKEHIDDILGKAADPVDTAIELCLYCMKAQIFNDGNKRASVIFANHFMISKGQGLLVIPESNVPEFKQLLVAYYENRDHGEIIAFMREKCWRTF